MFNLEHLCEAQVAGVAILAWRPLARTANRKLLERVIPKMHRPERWRIMPMDLPQKQKGDTDECK